MKVTIEITKGEEEALIKTPSLSHTILLAKEILEEKNQTLLLKNNDETFICNIQDILYIESVSNKTFVYLEDGVFESKLKLYELESLLYDLDFIRCSKSMICNIRKIVSVKAFINGRLDARMVNDERIIISRSYVKDLKRKLGMKEE